MKQATRKTSRVYRSCEGEPKGATGIDPVKSLTYRSGHKGETAVQVALVAKKETWRGHEGHEEDMGYL
jgi:hypothetical protein